MKSLLLVLFSACFVQALQAQQIKTVWPYRVSGGKMLVELKVNEIPRTFIFDTGGRTTVTDALCKELGLPVTDSIRVTDVNSKVSYYPVVTLDRLTPTDGKVSFTHVPALKLVQSEAFGYFGAAGLIGSDLLSRMIVTIDGKSRTITLTSAEVPPGVSFRKMLPFAEKGFMPVISLQTAPGSNIQVLFDTGNPSFLTLKESDFESLRGKEGIRVVDEGVREGSIGLGGVAESGTAYRVAFTRLTLPGTHFTGVIAETSRPPFSLIGIPLLEYGKVIIDYPGRRFYFEAEERQYEISGELRKVAVRVNAGDLVVSGIWGELREILQIGDRVTHINGKPAGKYDFGESITSGIPELQVPGRVVITVETTSGARDIVYKE